MQSISSSRSSSKTRQTRLFNRNPWTTTLISVLLLSSWAGLQQNHPIPRSLWGAQAQTAAAEEEEQCRATSATFLRVEDATGVGVLRAAANCTGGGSLQAEWAGAITIDSPISIASGMFLSITGDNEEGGGDSLALAEIRGGSQTRLFEVSPGGGLAMTMLRLSGGTASAAVGGGGGAIYANSGVLTLDSCVFQGNVAADGNGGAVWAEGGNVTILGGEFVGNNASVFGGAVAVTAATDATTATATTTATRLLVQEGAIFEGNTALVGGALYCSGVGVTPAESGLLVLSSTTASCSLSDTEFLSNTATGETDETVLFDEDFLEGVDGGGAVALRFAIADITGSVFRSNYAEFSGGALLGGNGTGITVNRCEFENNTAVEYGGAIAASSLTVGGNTQLTNNTAAISGGAVSAIANNNKNTSYSVRFPTSKDVILTFCVVALHRWEGVRS